MTAFPFDAVVGQDDAKLALRLAAVDPRIGGVLLRGEKGSAKTTLARGFARLLGDVPFVELPLGATEDRVVGTIDVRAALVGGDVRFQPGLLAAADGGVLYVDEVNLLADHLVDVLLDVAVSGVNVVERDGLSHRHPARFMLVGSMNPEEGELRPQLLDRFGLCVDVRASRDISDRVESVRRRLAFDATGAVDAATTAAAGASAPASLPEAVLDAASRLAVEVGAEGLRADLVLCRAAAVHAALDGRAETTIEDLRRVAHLVLAHRSRRGPFDPPVVPPEDLDQSVREVLDEPPAGDSSTDEEPAPPPPAPTPMAMGPARRPPVPPAASNTSARGRAVRDVPATGDAPVAVLATARAVAARRAGEEPDAPLQPSDLRATLRTAPRTRTVVACVDLSGSMGAPERAAAATGTVLGLLGDAYERRDRVALVGFHGDGASVLVAPTSSVEVARNRLGGLTTGGETPLAAGIRTGLEVALSARRRDDDALLVVLTDGRATGSPDAFDDAVAAAADVRRRGIAALVLDCERGGIRLGLAERLAEAMGARHVPADDLDPTRLAATIRAT